MTISNILLLIGLIGLAVSIVGALCAPFPSTT